MIMYDIGKMQYEKEKQMERRTKMERLMNSIRELDKKLLCMKICAVIWLMLLYPVIVNSNDGDLKQCSTILSVLAIILLLIQKKDIRE